MFMRRAPTMSKMADLYFQVVELFDLGYSALDIAGKLSLPIEMVQPVCDDRFNEWCNYECDY
jgi:hypothetical protein